MRNLFGISIILIVTQFCPAYGQWHDRIQTESDWELFYHEGYYDFNTYQIYREIIESNIVDTVDFIISSMGTSPGEITNSLLLMKRENRSERIETKPQFFPDRVKLGRRVYDNDNRGYVSISKKWDRYSIRFKFEDGDGTWRSSYRSVNYINDDFDFTLGNYSVKIGCGAGIGRFDYRPVSYEPDYERGEDILYSDNSFYNGAKMAYRGVSVIYSAKKYHDIRKRVIGGYWESVVRGGRIGFTSAAALISSDAGKRNLGSGSIFGETSDDKFALEIAYGESGFGYCLRARGNSDVLIKAWHYDHAYVNLQSSGYSHTDYESFSDKRFELSFRQPQKGETGLFTSFETTALFGEIRGSSEIWKKSLGSNIAMINSIYGLWDLTPDLIVNAGISQRDSYRNDRVLIESGTVLQGRVVTGARGSLWIANEKVNREKSQYYIFAFIPVGNHVLLKGRFSWSISGKFDYFIEQRSVLSEGFSINVTYRWDKDRNKDLGPFYLTMEKTW
ncbi:MAG: hypothetical protein V3W18_14210 [candidate division Zixibacteria bacterium]